MGLCTFVSVLCVVCTHTRVCEVSERRHETLGALDASRRSHRDERLFTIYCLCVL